MMIPNARDIRRLAMQLLYQMDVAGMTTAEDLQLCAMTNDDAVAVRDAAVSLAHDAWLEHGRADHLIAEQAPDWPTHRQPPVDRAILRLAYHEIASHRTPTKVAINEAVELAKAFAGEHSPSFINGVLDKLARKIPPDGRQKPQTPEQWLKDAKAG